MNLAQFSVHILKFVAKFTRFWSYISLHPPRTAPNALLMRCVARISFMGIINVPNMTFMFFWVGGKGGQKRAFSVRRMSEFYPLDFESTLNIFLCILNLMKNSIMIFGDILK